MNRAKTLAILKFSIAAVSILLIIIVSFSTLFFITQSVRTPGTHSFGLGDSLYFTLTTFITIGYGDYTPINDIGRTLVSLEALTSLFFSSAFAGILAYMLLKKEPEIFATKKMFIRFREKRYYLSLKIGNRGKPIVGVKVTIEFLSVTDELIRKRFLTLERKYAIIEKLIYVDLPITKRIHSPIRSGMKGERRFDIRVIVQGNNAVSGETVAFRVYYDPRDIRFGGRYKDVIKTWKRGKPSDLNWKNFNMIEKIDPESIQKFFDYKPSR